MIRYDFFLLENQEPRIAVEEPYVMLSDVSNCNLSYVEKILNSLKEVQNEAIDKFSWGGSDYCIIDSFRDESQIFYDFGESETAIPTRELIRLLEGWKAFLEEREKE